MPRVGAGAFTWDGALAPTFSGSLEPLPGAHEDERAMRWWASQPAAWEACRERTEEPEQAPGRFHAWVQLQSGRLGLPVMVAFPASYRAMWAQRYLLRFVSATMRSGGVRSTSRRWPWSRWGRAVGGCEIRSAEALAPVRQAHARRGRGRGRAGWAVHAHRSHAQRATWRHRPTAASEDGGETPSRSAPAPRPGGAEDARRLTTRLVRWCIPCSHRRSRQALPARQPSWRGCG